MIYKDTAILVFAKAPVSGTVNTRLIPAIGVEAATDLQLNLLHNRIKSLVKQSLCEVILMCSPDTNHSSFQQCASLYGVSLLKQCGENLGQRMSYSIKDALTIYKKVIVVGTDAPALHAEAIERAIVALSSNDVVLAPAEDGGYVLIGLSAYHPELFEKIEWGSDKVLQATEDKVSGLGLALFKLETYWDIDREEDYKRYLANMDTLEG